MPPNPPPTAGRPQTVRTIVLTVLATMVILFILVVSVVWYSNNGTLSYGVSQNRSTLSYGGESALDSGVTAKMSAPSMGTTVASPEIAPSPLPPIFDGGGATIKDRAMVDAKIIRTGSLNLRVDDAAKRLEEAKTLAKQFNGFVASSNLVDNGGVKTGYITVRVPSDKYDSLVAECKKLAVLVLSESSDAEDVTAQFVDLEARLKSAKAEEAQYLDILKQAKTVEDTLKVTTALNEVRSRIEQMQGQLRYLTDRTDYSTLNISLTEETKIQAPTKTWKPLETLRQAVQGLIISLQGLVDFLIGLFIYGLGFLLPLLILLYLVYRLVKWTIKKLFRKR